MTNKEIKRALLTEGTKFKVEDLRQPRTYAISRFTECRGKIGDGLSVHEVGSINSMNVDHITNNALSCYTFTLFGKKVVDRITFDRITIINE